METTAIVQGSLSAIARQNGQSLAESFVSADVIVIVDTSGSMRSNDSWGGKPRYDAACEDLAALQSSLPGKIAVLSFSDQVQFCPSGIPIFIGNGTNLAKALRFAKAADLDGMRFIVISDGQPDDEDGALRVAETYQNHIDVIYVGPERFPSGRDFLARLAAASGGRIVTADKAQSLLAAARQLLLKA